MPSYRAGRTPREVAAAVEALARLASNESPHDPLPAVVSAIETGLVEVNRYPEVRSGALKQKIADWLDVEPDRVAVGPGSAGLLWQIAQVFLDDGAQLVAPSPSFEGYPLVAQLMGAESIAVPVLGAVVDVDAMIERIGPATRLMVIAEPNNPTATSVGYDALAQLVARTAGRCMLVVDEAYVEYGGSGDVRRSLDLMRDHDHVVLLRTFSKAHGLAALRVGYAVGHRRAIELVDRVAPPFSVSALAHAAAAASLDHLDELHERVAATKRERERVRGALDGLGLAVGPSDTNFIWLPVGEQAEALAAELEQRTVIVRAIPGHGVRATIGEPGENDRLIAALASIRRHGADELGVLVTHG